MKLHTFTDTIEPVKSLAISWTVLWGAEGQGDTKIYNIRRLEVHPYFMNYQIWLNVK